jgi:four helix bundle protein
MTRSELEKRTKEFAIAVIHFVDKVPPKKAARLMGSQLLRSATSIGANYREANRAESRRDFVHKVAIVAKEAAESLYWIELFDEAMIGNKEHITSLLDECNQLVAIFSKMGKTAKENLSRTSAIRNPPSEIS